MALIYNGTEIDKVIYDGATLEELNYNGTTVYIKQGVILDQLSFDGNNNMTSLTIEKR